MKKNEIKIIKIMIENLVYWIHSDLSQIISEKQRLFSITHRLEMMFSFFTVFMIQTERGDVFCQAY